MTPADVNNFGPGELSINILNLTLNKIRGVDV